MNKLNDKAIAEAAYYIWKNNGCPANTHAQDWAAAIKQLSAAAKGKKISPVSAAGKLLAINLAAATNAALKTKTKTPLRKI